MRFRADILIMLLAVCASTFARANDTTGYETVRIIVPQDDATVYDNQGVLDVALEVAPRATRRRGRSNHASAGWKGVASSAKAQIRVTDVDRGTHRLQARVAAADGTLLLASPQIRFHMWRASRLRPGWKN